MSGQRIVLSKLGEWIAFGCFHGKRLYILLPTLFPTA